MRREIEEGRRQLEEVQKKGKSNHLSLLDFVKEDAFCDRQERQATA